MVFFFLVLLQFLMCTGTFDHREIQVTVKALMNPLKRMSFLLYRVLHRALEPCIFAHCVNSLHFLIRLRNCCLCVHVAFSENIATVGIVVFLFYLHLKMYKMGLASS